MKRFLATFISCLVLLSATVSVPALAEAKDEAQQADVSAFQDALTTAADGIQSVLDAVKTNIAELFDASDHPILEDSESAQVSELGASQDVGNALVIPSDIPGVVWDAGYTTCTLQSGHRVDGQALQAEIESHQSSLTTFVAENNTSLTGSAGNLFYGCTALSTVNLASSFSTGAVQDMTNMFSGCSALTSLTLPDSFDTSSVQYMYFMFSGCSALTSLTLPDSFDTSSVIEMQLMFEGCSALTSLVLPDAFDTSSARLMRKMFSGCSALTSLTLPDAFSTSALGDANDLNGIFQGCSSLTSLKLPDAFNISTAWDISDMFSGCSALTSLTLPDTSEIQDYTSVNNMFAVQDPTTGAFALRTLTLPKGFKMKEGTGLPGIASQDSDKSYWTTSIDSCVNFDTTEAQAITNINNALAEGVNHVTFSHANVALSFDANGGAYATNTSASQESVQNDDEVKSLFGTIDDVIDAADTPAPKLAGFKCTGWSVSRDGEALPTPITFPADDATYYAVWVPVVAITFDTNGHASFAGDQKTLSIDCVPGEKLTLPDEDTLTVDPSYIINGWFTEATGGTQVTDATDCPTTATTYYAQYTKEPGPTPGPTPEPTPEPTPDVVPAADTYALPLTGDTTAAFNSAIVAVLMAALALLVSGYSFSRKRSL